MRISGRKKRLWLGLVLGAMLLGGAVWGRGGEAEETKPQAALAVSTVRAAVTEKQQGLHLTGTVEGLTSAIISSRYSGQIEEISVENGQRVEAGQTLLRTDCQELANNVRMAQNGVRKAAGKARFRPIIMTTLTMMMGMLPLALGLGPGAEARAPMAHAILGGLVTSTVLTLVVIPCLYSLLRGVLERRRTEAKNIAVSLK